jgi:hypothetical protein
VEVNLMADGQVELIPFDDPRLGRHIRHDPRSRNFALPRGAPPTKDVKHRNWGRKLEQYVGSCTGHTGAHFLNHMPHRASVRPRKTMTTEDAMRFYSRATHLDPWPHVYPPTDLGSSGLAVCEAIVEEGLATRYEWAFGFDHGLSQISAAPLMQGSWWTYDMYFPDPDGRVHPTGRRVGGHEYLWAGVDVRRQRSWFLNSWGAEWGVGGRFYLTWDDHADLLAQDGDLVRPVA